MNIKGNKITVQKTQEETFNFLSELKNFEQLMPDSIQKFEVDEDSFVFGLKGMPEIILKQADSNPNEYIKFIAGGGKIDFSLLININEIDSNYCELDLKFEGDFNPMMAMMIKKPITSFLETLVSNAYE